MRTLLLTVLILSMACPAAASDASPLRLSGPPIAESLPLLAMAHNGQAWAQDFDVRFIPWHSPDMLRAMVAGGQVDAAIVTTAAASTLRNKGVNCRVALLHESPVWIVSVRPGADTLESLEGTLLFPFGPGEMPELFYKATMAGKQGNITTRHTGGALEAVNLLLAGKGDHAMLSEPTASIALLRSRAMRDKGAPLLVKRVDMCRAWERSFPGHRLAASCVAFFGPRADEEQQVRAFNAAYARACAWVKEHPEKALELARTHFPALASQMETGAVDNLEIHILEGTRARNDALFFLARINEISPAAIGGAMPGNDLFGVNP
ncbi:ABC transporter substrate-binding protein [Salidesulfovibrio onnuriiensis]|uniref:ABC transporter substrate-binding protein n=1 Tax=Salidesulfovibrio onnuriiensis TaxID=2583823 RepID=UPI0011C8C467|nr:ABC transporter substrate-binding protein [Salidesulfovibrio onnuriiensis]